MRASRRYPSLTTANVVNRSLRSFVKSVKVVRGAEIGSDYYLVLTMMRAKERKGTD